MFNLQAEGPFDCFQRSLQLFNVVLTLFLNQHWQKCTCLQTLCHVQPYRCSWFACDESGTFFQKWLLWNTTASAAVWRLTDIHFCPWMHEAWVDSGKEIETFIPEFIFFQLHGNFLKASSSHRVCIKSLSSCSVELILLIWMKYLLMNLTYIF